MSSRVKEHHDHTTQSIFHHGLIKLIISTALQREGKTWDYFLFWSGFQIKQEEQQTKKHVDKGKTLVRKLGQKIKVEEKKDIKLEEVTEPSKEDYEPKKFSANSRGKGMLFTKKEVVPSIPFSLKNSADNKLDQSMMKNGLCSVVMILFNPAWNFLQTLQ